MNVKWADVKEDYARKDAEIAALKERVENMDIVEWAKNNGLSPEEFQTQILTAAACAGMAMLELGQDDSDAMIFTCEDSIGTIELTVRRRVQDQPD